MANQAVLNLITNACKGARTLFLDTARKFFAFDENKSDEAALALYACDQIAKKAGCAVILIHHLVKPSGDTKNDMPDIFAIRGSSAIVADARWAAILCMPSEKFMEKVGLQAGERRRLRVLDVGKVSHAGQPDAVLFERDELGVMTTRAWPKEVRDQELRG